MVTSLEKFVFASHLRKPKIRNKALDLPKPITSQTLLISHGQNSSHASVELSPWYLECSVDAPVSQPRVLGKTVGDDLPLAPSAFDKTICAVPPGQDHVGKIVRLKT